MSYMGNGDGMGCDCGGSPLQGFGLAGMGLTVDAGPYGVYNDETGQAIVADTPTSPQSPTAPASWSDIFKAGEKIIEGILHPSSGYPPTYPVFTPPYLPSYPTTTQNPTGSMFPQTAEGWLPWIAGGLLIYAVISRRGR